MVLAGMCGCTQVPELGERVSDDFKKAPFPELVSLDRALGPAPAPEKDAEKVENELNARRSTLSRKAETLRKNPAIGQPQNTEDD